VTAEKGDLIGPATLRWIRDFAVQGIITTDMDLVVRSWNRWLVAVTGVPEESAVGRALFEVMPSFRERGFDQYYDQAKAGIVTVLSHSLHRFLLPRRADALPPPYPAAQSGRIAPLRDGDEVVGTITIIEDVSERVATERELRAQIVSSEAARRTAETASRVKDEFLATLSHEIRTPLNAVLGWTRILKSRDVDKATMNRAIEVIDRNAAAQLTLVSDLLDMSRIAAGKLRMNVTSVDLEPVAMAAMDVIRPAADAKNVRIVTRLETVPPVSGDVDRLSQVIWNLLSNAVKFTDPGGTVTIGLEADGGHVRLVVSDTGQGIDPGFLPHVFERFKQADPSASRRHGGLGLGLALVRELVELHGGTVTVASDGRGQGTTFTVTLRAIIDGFVALEPRRGDLAAGGASLSGVRVLVVEDERDAREIIAQSVQEFGAEVAAVASVPEALDYLRHQTPATIPHIIVTDIGMPGQDGFALLAEVRNLPREQGGEVPAIAVTAYATATDRQRTMDAGFKLHLDKPVTPMALAAAIARVAAGAS
jgi:signal transduction histidine kinase/CheY-like chemotaxis protein